MRPTLPVLLNLTGGYVDAAGYLALQGLFTAHVTGNFVTLGASLVYGTSGAMAKLLALPLFGAMVMLARLLGEALRRHGASAIAPLLLIKLALLIAGAILAIRLGPFGDGDSLPAIATGMALVGAMAVQNAVHRVHFGRSPPPAMMTGTTIQIMLDLTDLLLGMPPETRDATRARVVRGAAALGTFVVGCAAAALLYFQVQVWCFVVPPILAVIALSLRHATPEAEPK